MGMGYTHIYSLTKPKLMQKPLKTQTDLQDGVEKTTRTENTDGQKGQIPQNPKNSGFNSLG